MRIYTVSEIEYCTYYDEYFKQRSKDKFQKDIDSLILKLNIVDNWKFWKFYIENDYLECLSSSKSQDVEQMLKSIEFTNIKQAYFIYKVNLEFINFELKIDVQLGVVFNEDKKTGLQKKYFDKLLNGVSKSKKFTNLEIDSLDDLLKESQYKIEIHRNTKSTTANLLGVNKNSSFRVNTRDSIEYKIKSIKLGEIKKIKCPVCGSTETLNIDNKDILFQSKRNNIVVYTCKHHNHPDVKKKPVEISLQEYSTNLDGIDQVDFVIWNYKLLFEEFMKNMQYDPL